MRNQAYLIRRVMRLSWFTIIYNLLEGILSIGFGVDDDSVALAGFGIDSLIEVASATLVLWRFRSEGGYGSALSLNRERMATSGIGTLFLLLSTLTGFVSITQLHAGFHPKTTLPGLVISGLSMSFMFWLWLSKRSVASQLDSSTMMKDADCSLVCIKLSGVLLAGSLLFVLRPEYWWADSLAALILAFLIGKEGWQTVRGAQDPEFSGGCGCQKKNGTKSTQ